jgi:hypothetical protein
MQYMVVIGKADKLAVRAENMYMAAATQRAWCIGRSDIHGVEVVRLALPGHNATAMVEIVMPAFVRTFGTMDEDIFICRWMNGHHTNASAMHSVIEDLDIPVLTLTRSIVSPLKDAPDGRTSKTSHWLSAVQVRVLVS